jgi:hypothetical protein
VTVENEAGIAGPTSDRNTGNAVLTDAMSKTDSPRQGAQGPIARNGVRDRKDRPRGETSAYGKLQPYQYPRLR